MSSSGMDLGVLGLVPAENVSGKMPEAVWPGNGDDGWMYKGCLGFIAGPSGAGKSLSTHKIMADWTCTRGRVILCEGEDGGVSGGMSKLRLEAAGAKMSNVAFAEYRIPQEVARLEEAILALQADGSDVLVVWDTADTFIDAPPQKWGKALHPLVSGVLPRTGAIGLLVHHTLKNAKRTGDWRSAVGGATAGLVGKSRFGALYGYRPDDGSQRILLPVKDSYRDVKGNGTFNRGIAFEFDEEDLDDGSGKLRPVSYLRIAEKKVSIANPTELVYLGGDGNGPRGPSPEKAAEAAQWVTEMLADGCAPVTDAYRCMTHPDGNPAGQGCGYIAGSKGEGGCPYCGGPTQLVQGMKETCEQDGISWGTVRRALVALQCISGRKGSKDAAGGLIFYWRLPDGHPGIANPNNYVSVLP